MPKSRITTFEYIYFYGRGKKKTPVFSEPVNASEKITDPKKLSTIKKPEND